MKSIINNLINFWKTGKGGKLIIITVSIVILICICCVGLIILGNNYSSSPTYRATKTAEAFITQTFIALPTNTSLPSDTAQPSNTPEPSITLGPSITVGPTSTTFPTETYTITPTLVPTSTPLPTKTNTITPTLVPTQDMRLKLSLTEFVNYYDSLTDLQKEDYVATLPGRTVDWTGKVIEVSSNGTILIDIPGTLLSTVTLNGVPLEIAKTINKDSYIRFTGVIDDISDFLGLHIDLVDIEIIK